MKSIFAGVFNYIKVGLSGVSRKELIVAILVTVLSLLGIYFLYVDGYYSINSVLYMENEVRNDYSTFDFYELIDSFYFDKIILSIIIIPSLLVVISEWVEKFLMIKLSNVKIVFNAISFLTVLVTTLFAPVLVEKSSYSENIRGMRITYMAEFEEINFVCYIELILLTVNLAVAIISKLQNSNKLGKSIELEK